MKKNRQLQNLARKLIEVSFKEGKMVESQVIRSIKLLKSLPRSKAILALSEYLKQLKRIERHYTMVVETSIPLSPTILKKMKKIVERNANDGYENNVH